jgi:outer membrane protein
MKKTTVLILLACLSLQLNAQKKKLSIGMLLDYHTPIADSLLTQLKQEISSVIGEDADMLFPKQYTLINDYNYEKATTNYQQLLAEPVDIIIVLGTIGELTVQKQSNFKKPTIVFGGNNLDDRDTHIEKVNLTHIVDQALFSNDLKELNKLTSFKRVGIAIEKPYVEALDPKPHFNKITQELNVQYKLIKYEDFSDIESQLDGIDAFYLSGGHLIGEEEIKSLADLLLEKEIPSMTVGGISHLEKGFLVTTLPQGNYDQLIRKIALAVDSYVRNTPLPKMSVMLDYKPKLTVNFNVAEVLGISIPYSSINNVDFIGNADRLDAEETFSFESFLVSILEKNLGFNASKKEVLQKNQDVKFAKSSYMPSLEASSFSEYVSPKFAEISFGQNPEFQSIANLSLNQTIYSPQASANIEIEKNLLQMEQQRLSSTELDLVLEASNAYFNALLAKAETNIQANNLQLTKTNFEIAQQNFESGQSDKSDVLRLKSRLAMDKQQMVTAINRMEQAFVQLNQLINNPLDKKVDVEDVKVGKGFFQDLNYNQFEQILDNDNSRELFVQFLTNESKVNSPELKTLDYFNQVTNEQLKLFGSRRLLPTVGFQASYSSFVKRNGVGSEVQGFDIPDDYLRAGVGVTIPIFSGSRNNISHQKAKVQKEQISLNMQDTELSLEAGVRNIIFEVINQMATINLTRETEKNAAEALELIQDAYSNGAISVVQLFDVQNIHLQAQISRTQADYGYLISIMNLERIIAHYSILNTSEANKQLKERFLTFKN